jgi:hypothetical protein
MDAPNVDPELLNLALDLSLEFGPAWRQPIQSRLRNRRPQVTVAQADELDTFARRARDWAHELITRSLNGGVPTQEEAKRTISLAMPWIDSTTFARLWSQGCYYAMK